jgi:protein-tyrosine phosphatase
MPDPHSSVPGAIIFNIGHVEQRNQDLPIVLRAVKQCVVDGGSILVHCMGGRHRGPTAAALCLMATCCCTFEEAVSKIEHFRPICEVHMVVNQSFRHGRHFDPWINWIHEIHSAMIEGKFDLGLDESLLDH